MWKLILGLALVAGVIAAAEVLGRRAEVYAGAGGGLLLGLAGLLAAVRIVARQKAIACGAEQGHDIWAAWGAGLLVRFVLLGLVAWLFWWIWGPGAAAPMLSLAAVYLAMLFGETAWLYLRLNEGSTDDGRKHG